jgi:hypothetical protein
MIKLYKILNYEVSQHLAKVLIICAGTLVSPLMLLNRAIDYSNYYKRFETIYESSGYIIVFAVFFAAICGICFQSFYSNYFGSKSIYTLVTIPMKREAIYFSKLISFFIYFLMFFAAQLISVFIAHGMISSQVARCEDGKYLINNSLFLAFIRSGFLRILMPLGLEGIVSTVSMFAVIVCGLYYAMLCERSKRFWGFAPIAAVIYILVRVITYRLNQGALYPEYVNLYVFSIILFCFCGFFIWHGIRLYKRGAIT